MQDSLAELPGAGGIRSAVRIFEIGDKKCRARLPGDLPEGANVNFRRGVGKASMPAGDRRLIIQFICRIPAENNIAEAEALFQCRFKLLNIDVFPPHDTVYIKNAQFDLVNLIFFQLFKYGEHY